MHDRSHAARRLHSGIGAIAIDTPVLLGFRVLGPLLATAHPLLEYVRKEEKPWNEDDIERLRRRSARS